MAIFGFSNSAANKGVLSKIWKNGVQLSDWVENIVGKGEIAHSHYVFKSCLLSMHQNEYLWSKRLTKIQICLCNQQQLQHVNPFPNKSLFLRVCSTSHLKTQWRKEKMLVMSNLTFSAQCFQPFWRTFPPFSFKIVDGKLFKFGRV